MFYYDFLWLFFFQERNRGKLSFWHINKFQGTDLPGFTTGFVEPAFVSDRPIYVLEQQCKSSDSVTVPITVGSVNAQRGIVLLPCFLVENSGPLRKKLANITSLTWALLVGRVWGIILAGCYRFPIYKEMANKSASQYDSSDSASIICLQKFNDLFAFLVGRVWGIILLIILPATHFSRICLTIINHWISAFPQCLHPLMYCHPYVFLILLGVFGWKTFQFESHTSV